MNTLYDLAEMALQVIATGLGFPVLVFLDNELGAQLDGRFWFEDDSL